MNGERDYVVSCSLCRAVPRRLHRKIKKVHILVVDIQSERVQS